MYPKRDFKTRVAARYFRDFPIQRGRGLMNRFLGKFLQVEVFEGMKLRLINPLEYHQHILLMGEERLEAEVTDLLSTLLRPGMVFFDVGANLGYYTLLASTKIGSSGQVHAFEPAPNQFHHLKLNVGINCLSNVRINNCALDESSGSRDLFLSEGWNQGTHSFGNTLNQSGSCSVSCLSIDEYVKLYDVKSISIMKVDVEGAELLVFRGAEQTFATMPPHFILFEACEEYAQVFGYTTSDVKLFLERRGYEIYRLEASGSANRVTATSPEKYANLIAIHGRAEDWYWKSLDANARITL